MFQLNKSTIDEIEHGKMFVAKEKRKLVQKDFRKVEL